MRLLPMTAQVLDRGSQVTKSSNNYGFRVPRGIDDSRSEPDHCSHVSSQVYRQPNFENIRTVSQQDEHIEQMYRSDELKETM